MKRIIAFILVLITLSSLLIACGNKNKTELSYDTTPVRFDDISYTVTKDITNYVKIEMSDLRCIIIELYPDVAPITVKNFQKLVSEGFYDGTIFHRVIDNMLIQGGDPTGTGYGGSDKAIKGEFAANGVMNPLAHERGVISMARSKSYNSASSQFFICCGKNPSWDGQYAAFGKVIAGMDVVDDISAVSANSLNKPLTDQVMKTVRFVTVSSAEPESDTTAG